MLKHVLTMHNHDQKVALCSQCGLTKFIKVGKTRAGNQRYSCTAKRPKVRPYRYDYDGGSTLLSAKQRDDIVERFKECFICKKPLRSKTDKHLDHCHDTGRFRGVLCREHNLALGYFNDNVEHLETAIKYLRLDTDVSVC